MFGIFERARAVDHLVGEFALLVDGHLSGDAEFRILPRESAFLQTFELLLGAAPADNHAIEVALRAGFGMSAASSKAISGPPERSSASNHFTTTS